jgi:hypothetical protein
MIIKSALLLKIFTFRKIALIVCALQLIYVLRVAPKKKLEQISFQANSRGGINVY